MQFFSNLLPSLRPLGQQQLLEHSFKECCRLIRSINSISCTSQTYEWSADLRAQTRTSSLAPGTARFQEVSLCGPTPAQPGVPTSQLRVFPQDVYTFCDALVEPLLLKPVLGVLPRSGSSSSRNLRVAGSSGQLCSEAGYIDLDRRPP